jgi:hypothetical protein
VCLPEETGSFLPGFLTTQPRWRKASPAVVVILSEARRLRSGRFYGAKDLI